MTDYITISIFDIFKPGPGPSSSHTIGPMRAASDFLNILDDFLQENRPDSPELEVFLYGSLSSTGEGHGTHRAVMGGLLGWKPESCDCDKLREIFEEEDEVYQVNISGLSIKMNSKDIHFAGDDKSLPFQNTVIFKLSEKENILLEEEYYSIGGGFIQRKGEKEPGPIEVLHKYRNMNEFRRLIRRTELSLAEIMIQNEETISGKTRKELYEEIDKIIDTMCEAVENGLRADGILPGPIGLMRKAGILFKNSKKCATESERALARLNSFAMAAAEENAAGKRVVTAPTSGSAGVLPGIIYLLKNYFNMSDEKLREGLLASALIASVAKHNASIAGAEVGCQGEIGVASSMAAAFVAYAKGCNIKRVDNAAEIALEHHLGMTCDPVDGFVQVPCIERNAVGAVTAFNAYILASVGDPARQKITFDEVVEAMLETGNDMCSRYKETAKGGLAICAVCC
jgi:L-serine dehydratase